MGTTRVQVLQPSAWKAHGSGKLALSLLPAYTGSISRVCPAFSVHVLGGSCAHCLGIRQWLLTTKFGTGRDWEGGHFLWVAGGESCWPLCWGELWRLGEHRASRTT